MKDRMLHTCAISSQRNDSTLPNKVNQLLLGTDCRIDRYSIWSFGRNFLKFLEIWFNEETLLTAWHAQCITKISSFSMISVDSMLLACCLGAKPS